MTKYFGHALLVILTVGIICLSLQTSCPAREITDMAGRKVTIPDNPQKVYAPEIIGEYMMISLAPDLLCGLVRPLDKFHPNAALMIPAAVRNLPIVGSLTANSQMGSNPEILAAIKPDLAILVEANTPQEQSAAAERGTALLDKMGIPYIYVQARHLGAYPEAYRFLGDVLGRGEHAAELASYIEDVMAENERILAQVPPEKRPKIYYAVGVDGLNTTGRDSFRANLLLLAGDLNVHAGSNSISSAPGESGYNKVSVENVMTYAPDIIFAFDKPFYDKVYTSSAWKYVKAVQNQQVYLVPWSPFNWFDRPPSSFMGAIGLQLILSKAYPEHYTRDIVAEARKFCKLFFNADLTYEEMLPLIYPGNDAPIPVNSGSPRSGIN